MLTSIEGNALSSIAFWLLFFEALLHGADYYSDEEKAELRLTPSDEAYDLRLPSLRTRTTTQTSFTDFRHTPLPRTPASAHIPTITRLSRTPSIRSVYVEDKYECPICWEGGIEDLEAQSTIEYSSLPCKHIFCTKYVSRPAGFPSSA